MMRRFWRVAVLTIAMVAGGLGGCGGKPPAGPGSAPPATSGDAVDNPLLAFAPADTPYAFASFKPISIDFLRAMAKRFGPLARRGIEQDIAKNEDPEATRRRKAFLAWFDLLDLQRFEELGFSAKARFAIYGLGAYFVARVEIANGDRLYDSLQRLAERGRTKLPPPTVRGSRRYWIENVSGDAALIAVNPTEMVFAVAPRAIIDRNLPALLGEQRPANSLAGAQLRELGAHHGFTGQGIGFVDLSRALALGADAENTPPPCRQAVVAVAQRIPRVVFGFDDFTPQRLAFGMALELAPDLLAAVRSLSTPLVGYDRVVERNPAMAVALALDVDQGRELLSRIAGGIRGLGEQCRVPKMIVGAEQIAEAAASPLPPMFAGLRGGFVAFDELRLSGGGAPTKIEGYGIVQGDHIADLVQFAAAQAGLKIAADGTARPLPSMSPYPGHVAASPRVLSVALGPNSAATATELLAARSSPAPLGLLRFDYSQLGELMASLDEENRADENARELMTALGLMEIKLVVGDRGVAGWLSFALH